MPYHRVVGNLPPSTMLLFTPGDAKHAARDVQDPVNLASNVAETLVYFANWATAETC